MPAERYYHPQKFQPENSIQLEGTEFHHLTNVMRNRPGDTIELVNGKGELGTALVDSITKKYATLSVSTIERQKSNTQNPLILVQSIPRMNRLEFILEKSTELGVDEIWLLPAAHSEKKELSEHQLQRLEALLIASMKQCGRLWLPLLKIVDPLKKWKPPELPMFFGDTSPNAPLFADLWKKNKPQKGALFFIGPESGFTKEEEEMLKQLGAQGVKLHQNILRTDTAALVALSLMSHEALTH